MLIWTRLSIEYHFIRKNFEDFQLGVYNQAGQLAGKTARLG